MINKILDKRSILGFLFIMAFVLCSRSVHAQEANETPQAQQPTDTKSQKKLAAKQKEQAKQKKKATQEALKQHMKNQTPEVRKRMKEDAKRAEHNNSH